MSKILYVHTPKTPAPQLLLRSDWLKGLEEEIAAIGNYELLEIHADHLTGCFRAIRTDDEFLTIVFGWSQDTRSCYYRFYVEVMSFDSVLNKRKIHTGLNGKACIALILKKVKAWANDVDLRVAAHAKRWK